MMAADPGKSADGVKVLDTSPRGHVVSGSGVKRVMQEFKHRRIRLKGAQLRRLHDRVFERDGNRCIECGSTYWLEMSHNIPRSLGGDDSMENCWTRCKKCHIKRDGHGQPMHF